MMKLVVYYHFSYEHAWDIFNNKENYQDFIAELKKYNDIDYLLRIASCN